MVSWIAPVLISIVVLVVVGVVMLLAGSYLLARRMLRPLRTAIKRTPAEFGLTAEDIRIASPRGELAAWYIPARNGCTLICCHGIHDNRSQWVEQVARLHARSGYGALLFDLGGHGESADSLVTYGARETEDVAAVMAYLQYTMFSPMMYVPHMVFLDARGVIRADVPAEDEFFRDTEANIRKELDKLLKGAAVKK